MKDLGTAKRILGMEITRYRDKGKLYLTQKGYLQKVLESYHMSDCKTTQGPIANHFRLCVTQCPRIEEEKEYMKTVPYASAVGSLMFAMICTRPDLAYAISFVSRFMSNPGKEH